MNSEIIYDVAVIGAGMFGSAAAKYLAAAGLRTLIIGAEEPQDWQEHDGVFGSHYDEARITRIVDPDPYWGEMQDFDHVYQLLNNASDKIANSLQKQK